jgi:putative heme-binding domain-containing protein
LVLALAFFGPTAQLFASDESRQPARNLPRPAAGWSIELVAEAPKILYPTAIVTAPDRAVYVGSDPMDMPGPPTVPLDRIYKLKDGRASVFADKLWSVMGLEWLDGTLYVVHAPFLSALRDANGDGKADSRLDLVTGLGPKLPGFNGINDHIASGIRLGMDGFLYIAVGDKGIPRATGRDGTSIQLHGGGVIRVRPDGTGLEVVSTGECNPLSVALSASDEIFSYGNDDDAKQWPNSLTHHIVGGHYGYPYQFQTAPARCLPIMSGQLGGAGAQGICYNEDGLPAEYRGNLFVCDWGLQTVLRFVVKKAGGTFRVAGRTELVTKGNVNDFRPFSLAVSAEGDSLLLVDWAYNGWLAAGPKTGRLYRLRYTGKDQVVPAPRLIGDDIAPRIEGLDHPALSVRLESQWSLARKHPESLPLLAARLKNADQETGRLHALWALDFIGGPQARAAIAAVLRDPSPRVRLQAARSMGIRRDRAAENDLLALLKDRDASVRREAAIAIGRLGNPSAASALYAALDDPDAFACWSIRLAIRNLRAWDKDALISALMDDRRRESALQLADEAWAVSVVAALTEVFRQTGSVPIRARVVTILAGLYRQYPAWSGLWFGTNPLAGPVPGKTRDWSDEGMKAVLDGLLLALKDTDRGIRYQAIYGLRQAGPKSIPLFRAALAREPDPENQALLVETLASFRDTVSTPMLVLLLNDAARAEHVRLAAADALTWLGGPDSLRARMSLLYDATAPPALIARILPGVARAGFLPPNDLASFFESPAAPVRTAAILSLNVKRPLPKALEQAVLARLDDQAAEVREAAMLALVPLRLQAAIPRLLAIAALPQSTSRSAAVAALCALPDPRALHIYLEAIQDRNPAVRRAGESALLAIRQRVIPELASLAASERLSGQAALSVERVLAHFEPIAAWRVIGPFPRATPQVFLGAPRIDWTLFHAGAGGKPVAWVPRQADAATGRINLADFSRVGAAGAGTGFDATASPDLCAFAYAEFDSQNAAPALLLIGSSGTVIVTVNEKLVYQYTNPSGRPSQEPAEVVRIELAKGRNRVLVLTRQGIGDWSFSLQVAKLTPHHSTSRPAPSRIATLREFAMRHEGDPAKGEKLFFNPDGAQCGQCHSIRGRGKSTVGPDLTGLAAKYDRAEIIRSVVEPSIRIATGYQPLIVATRGGGVFTGVVHAETDQSLELADSQARISQIPKKDIEARRAGTVSVMPLEPVESLSPAEFADLISFLCGLKAAPIRIQDPRFQP